MCSLEDRLLGVLPLLSLEQVFCSWPSLGLKGLRLQEKCLVL